jgi:type III secretory pathway component EscS
LNFHFTEFSEVRYRQATPKQQQKSLIWVMRLVAMLATVVALANWRG